MLKLILLIYHPSKTYLLKMKKSLLEKGYQWKKILSFQRIMYDTVKQFGNCFEKHSKRNFFYVL